MNIVVAEDLYPESLEGDEPEPLPQVRWPLAHLMDLLEDPDFHEARNVSALFLVREWLKGQGRLLLYCRMAADALSGLQSSALSNNCAENVGRIRRPRRRHPAIDQNSSCVSPLSIMVVPTSCTACCVG